jgi:hypothetical protein
LKNAFIIDHKRNIIYTEVPKCGSTTVHQLFLDVFGFKNERGPHHAIWSRDMQAEREQAGIESIRIKDAALDTFIADHPNYRFFTITRNPYSRCISAYTNQLRRFAKKRHPTQYLSAKIQAKLAALKSSEKIPSKSSKYDFLNNILSQRISFDEVLENLDQYGPSFDKHFDLQVNIVKPDIIPYFRVLDLENLSEGLGSIFGETIHFDKSRKLNSSSPAITPQTMPRRNREAIHRIYARDFEAFGYSA